MSTKIVSFLLSLLLVLAESGCSSPESETANTTPPAESEAVVVTKADFTVDTPIADVMTDPAFGSFGRLLFPVQSSYYRGDTLGELSLTWYSHIDPGETVEIVNTLKNSALSGQTLRRLQRRRRVCLCRRYARQLSPCSGALQERL